MVRLPYCVLTCIGLCDCGRSANALMIMSGTMGVRLKYVPAQRVGDGVEQRRRRAAHQGLADALGAHRVVRVGLVHPLARHFERDVEVGHRLLLVEPLVGRQAELAGRRRGARSSPCRSPTPRRHGSGFPAPAGGSPCRNRPPRDSRGWSYRPSRCRARSRRTRPRRPAPPRPSAWCPWRRRPARCPAMPATAPLVSGLMFSGTSAPEYLPRPARSPGWPPWRTSSTSRGRTWRRRARS